MKIIEKSTFDEGLMLLSDGKVVSFSNEDMTLDFWLERIGFNVDEDCSPFGYFFSYESLVTFDDEEIPHYFEVDLDDSARARSFTQNFTWSSAEFFGYVGLRIQNRIESGDHPIVVIGTITDGQRKVFVGYEVTGHSWEGVRHDCLGLFENLDDFLSAHFSNGVFETLYANLDDFNRSA